MTVAATYATVLTSAAKVSYLMLYFLLNGTCRRGLGAVRDLVLPGIDSEVQRSIAFSCNTFFFGGGGGWTVPLVWYSPNEQSAPFSANEAAAH